MEFAKKELDTYQKIINNTKPGIYKLKDLFRDIWDSITPTTFGKTFYDEVDFKKFNNIKHSYKNTTNHHFYEITT